MSSFSSNESKGTAWLAATIWLTTAAHALQNAKPDQRVRRPGQAAQGRRERERREAPEGLSSNALDQPAAQRKHESKREEIAARDPLNYREAAVQLHGERGERYVDHRRIELRKKRANHSNRCDLPDPRV